MGLNRQKLEAALHAGRQFTYLPFSLHLFERVSSTNQVLWEKLKSGAEPGCVVIATQQTAGRGQWGRQWISPVGGLYLSVAIAPKLEAINSYQLTLATAWGIARQLRDGGVPVGIKWPNDLVLISIPDRDSYIKTATIDTIPHSRTPDLLDTDKGNREQETLNSVGYSRGSYPLQNLQTVELRFSNSQGLRKILTHNEEHEVPHCSPFPVKSSLLDENSYNYKKLGGILTETKVHKGQITQAVIGVGINWANPVPETGINLETWQANQHPKPISSLEMLTSLVLLGIESGILCLFQEGVDILLSRYLELLTNVGERVNVNNFAATVVGVTHTGELHVRMETSELKTVITPEIYLQPGTISLGYRKSSK